MRIRGLAAFSLSAGAIAWAALLIVGAFTVDVYSGESHSSPGVAREFGATLVEVNGTGVLWFVSVPLVLCVAAFFLLRRVCTTGSRRAGSAVAGITALMLLVTMLGAASVGMFFAPAVLALMLAQAVVPAPR